MTLLDPEERRLYTDALRPPPGMTFDAGVGTTYSLDLETLLTVPLHLLLYSGEEGEEELLESGVALLRALRSISSRLTIYCERGRILEPAASRRLYGLLEEITVPVAPPSEHGSFHPKLWLLRFRDSEEGRRHLRLLVLSRNLTRDLSWDLMLRLEGKPGEEVATENAPLVDFLDDLGGPPSAGRAESAARPPSGSAEDGAPGDAPPDLLDDLRHTSWKPPEGFDCAHFHVTGPGRGGWLPEKSDRLLVVSPFLSAAAVEKLAGTTEEARSLVSRPAELLEMSEDALSSFGDVYELDELDARPDGAEDEEAGTSPRGLHAKLYLAERGDRTHLYAGSANATNAALLGGRNVEVMAELTGPADRVGGIDEVLDPEDGLLPLLREWLPPDEAPDRDDARKQARERLEGIRRRLAGSDLRLDCRREQGEWRLDLLADEELDLDGLERCEAWPVTVARDTAVEVGRLGRKERVELPGRALTSLTTFIAFRLVDGPTGEEVTFVLNLPVTGLPREERDAALIRHVIRDPESFLRYLLLLLGEVDEESVLGDGAGGGIFSDYGRSARDELPLLEELTRAYCRKPERLEEVRELMEDLRELATRGNEDEDDGNPEDVIPEEFRKLWAVFEEALRGREAGAR